MIDQCFRIESEYPIVGPLTMGDASRCIRVVDSGLAVSIAAKSNTQPPGGEIRVIYEPSGEVVFRKCQECSGSRAARLSRHMRY